MLEKTERTDSGAIIIINTSIEGLAFRLDVVVVSPTLNYKRPATIVSHEISPIFLKWFQIIQYSLD